MKHANKDVPVNYDYDPSPYAILGVVACVAALAAVTLWLVMQPVGSECPDMGPSWEGYCPAGTP